MKILKSNLNRLEDPTQQGKNRRGAKKYSDNAIEASADIMEEWIRSVPTTKSESGKLTYLLTPESDPNSDFEAMLLAAFLLNGSFFLNQNVEGAFRSGALGTNRDLLQQLSSPTLDTTIFYNFDSVFQSREYQTTLSAYQTSAKDSINGISKEASARISSLILLGMAAGLVVAEILEQVRRQMEIMNSRIDRVINTTINQGLNEGKLIAAGLAAAALGMTGLIRHRSALLPTTRPHHAARHNKIYTVETQRAWWATGSNRINCYCSVHAVLKKL